MIKQLFTGTCLLLLQSCMHKDAAVKQPAGKSQWTQDSTTHFRLKAQQGVRSAGNLKAVGEKMEGIQQELLTLLNETGRQQLVVYFLPDRQTLASYTGFPANGYTDTQNGIIYFVDRDPFHLALRHETMHALSWRLWGPASTYWLSEGLAVYAGGSCGDNDLHTLAHALSRQGKITSFTSLTENFDFRELAPTLQAASMVKFIYENYGVQAVKQLWKSGLQNTADSIGIAAEELEQRWKTHIAQEQFNTNVNFDKIKEQGCE